MPSWVCWRRLLRWKSSIEDRRRAFCHYYKAKWRVQSQSNRPCITKSSKHFIMDPKYI